MSEIADLDDTAEKTYEVKRKRPNPTGWGYGAVKQRATCRYEVNADLWKIPVTLPKLRYMDK